MADRFESRYTATRDDARTRVAIDEGLRSFMLRVYNFMASGVLLTGAVSYSVSKSPSIMQAILSARWLLLIGVIVVYGFFLLPRLSRMGPVAAHATFWSFAALFGAIIAPYFLIFTQASIAKVFFITSGAFAGLSLWGYTTKKDLSGWGSFLIMGTFGLVIAIIVNLFLQSPALHFAYSAIGVLIFSGWTAYDTQRIKNQYITSGGGAISTGYAIQGAAHLYLDFLNLFIFLMNLFGNR